jgi:small-conductance mechanosensitive channel
MLNLAQVQIEPTSGKTQLQVLARQISEYIWEVGTSDTLLLAKESSLGEGVLVLVELGEERQIISIQEAKDWILSILQQHLTKNAINHQFVAEEQSKVEQWRQEITAQNLELNRRALEIETRREQLQELEQTLKQDREELTKQQQKLVESSQQKQVEI